ncbi:hypothetical protein LTR10_007548 [Elasticomyces elasticus]|nr:hypothetical protein LTR10_007548 [Elasticomyces elasticus]KAK4979356.1 hypothetical protein LTR42_001859 [Elasticomyces elasticus]
MTDSVMGIKMEKESVSGDTTPDYPKTPTAQSSVGNLKRRGSQESLSAITEADSVESAETGTSSLNYPAPPLNSPMTQSEIGDRETPTPASIVDRLEESIAEKLRNLSGNLADYTPPTSPVNEGDEERKRIERTISRRSEDTATPVLTKPKWGDRSKDTSPGKENKNIFTGVFPEHSNWADFADQDVVVGLKRLMMLAMDINKVEPNKTVERIYSERLAKLIKEGEIKFDTSFLQ